MMWETSVLPQNGRLLAVGSGREAMANDAHGVNVRKNHEAPVCQKICKKKRSDVELWRESAYDSNDRSVCTICTMATIWGKIVKPAVLVSR